MSFPPFFRSDPFDRMDDYYSSYDYYALPSAAVAAASEVDSPAVVIGKEGDDDHKVSTFKEKNIFDFDGNISSLNFDSIFTR